MTEWGPTGELVYNRTYSRTKPDGSKETWPETVRRVVEGNINLAPKTLVPGEKERLIEMMKSFKILPGGRHLWASGVKGRQYLFNCHVSGWGEELTDHFQFSFMRLMEGGGVGANYSNKHLERYKEAFGCYNVHIVCDSSHPDYEEMQEAGVLSAEYGADWEGSFAVEDSREGWSNALVDLMQTYYRDATNTNRVFDVSRVRGKGSRLQTFGGSASGPLPLAVMLTEVSWVMNTHSGIPLTGLGAMQIDHAIATCVVSGGNRRSARMSMMAWDDPEIFEFLRCKEDTDQHWTTNISVELDERFWDSVNADVNSGRMGHARMVLHGIAQGMLTNGEPGIWNADLSNKNEPGEVIATNPCGEIPLEAWENCNLGHVNLSAFVNGQSAEVQGEELATAHVLMTRFLIRATFGDVNDPKQAEALARNRRIGVGHMGFASFIGKLGYRYSEIAYAPEMKELLTELSELVDRIAIEYAHILRIPVPVKKRTIAPTGTIAKMPGISEGIHPIFSQYFIRRIRLSTVDPNQLEMIEDYRRQGYHVEPCRYAPHTMVIEIPTKDSLLEEVSSLHGAEVAAEIVESAEDLTLVNMLAVQELYQEYWADNAVSFTANVNPEKVQIGQLMTVLDLFSETLKGVTIFPELSRQQAPYERISKEAFEASSFGTIADSVDEECMSGACPVR